MTKTTYSESQLVNIKQQFNALDQDNDGFITEAEFLEALKNASRDPKEYDSQKFFSDADKNKDGKISFSEFAEACGNLGLGVGEPISGQPTKKDPKEVDEIFRNFDLDGNGSISAKELGKVMASQGESLTESELQDMINAADKNQDNRVDREEFSKMV
ncbi:Calcium-binding protein 7 [Mortierella alpina]|nr:Calcium-binding protein 7 [Mortierella alpina]